MTKSKNYSQIFVRNPVWLACTWFFFICAAFNIGRFALVIDAISLISSPIQFGLYLALFPFIQWAISATVGRLLDVSPVRRFFVATGVLILVAWPFLEARSVWGLIIGCVLINVASLLATLACQKYIGINSTAIDRTSNFNLFSLSATAATLVGPAAEGFIRLKGQPQYFNIAFLAFALVGMLFLLFWRDGRSVIRKDSSSKSENYKHTARLRSVFIGAGAIFGSVAVFLSYLPGLMEKQENVAVAGFAITAYSTGSIISRFFLPSIERRLGLNICFTLMLAVAALGLALVNPKASLSLILLASFVYGIGIGCATPIASAICHAESIPENLGAHMGLMSSYRKFAEMGILICCTLIPASLLEDLVFFLGAAVLLGASGISFSTRPSKAPESSSVRKD